MLGEDELVKIFPDFADLVQPSGIDLELDKIYVQKSAGSLIDNEKNLIAVKGAVPGAKGGIVFIRDSVKA